ncbi:response regulator transcription factor [Rhodovulum sulfidophilum]|uniref:Response regulator transcription factor n=1 Tax=Rhodovulum sulfidophilum TaxID=35806 RepID=A0ABS1RW31_RHOSU|nr:response regulator transcription factor [Rhodovulum sulfidophilum]ANB36225.1 DNA-binding response regulator [Rhodovulum sulfidophilum DSM 1374]MBL3553975.1 response regulator transcription factor [Rhodovulum sulfidophilum]MBL3562356.1 response regulator transcription factor [Rhodovulum sulfidophilum]MBL3565945.1 response regulator transcription factor [Rhodovulum sulfidophilum]MBL3575108.1 response regulator transcription factor [Rhodovulum sulfidophilum]
MKVLVADDHELLRDTLELYFQQSDGVDADFVGDYPSALEKMQGETEYDLVLLDYSMRGMNGLEGLKAALDVAGSNRVALMSGIAPRDVAAEALNLGAAGFVPKTLSAKSLLSAVRFMAEGERYAPIDFLMGEDQTSLANPLAEKLLSREVQVLRRLRAGMSNKEIARELGVTEPTVKLYLKSLFRKINVNNRTQAALFAQENGLF